MSDTLQSRFFRPILISEQLSVFLGVEKGAKMSRIDITREINKYIRLNCLQDETNRVAIIPDTNISILFGLNEGDVLTHLNLQKYIRGHLIT